MATAKKKDWRYWMLIALGMLWLVFQLYIALISPLDKWIQVPLHLCLGLAVCFLNKPMAYTFKNENKMLNKPKPQPVCSHYPPDLAPKFWLNRRVLSVGLASLSNGFPSDLGPT